MGLKSADAANQERRSMRLMIVEINVSRITDADQEFPAAGLFLSHDPRSRSTDFQDLVAAIGCEYGDGRVGQRPNP
jgi:hypothetical protein